MNDSSTRGEGLRFDGVFKMRWHTVSADQEDFARARLEAGMRSYTLLHQGLQVSDDARSPDETDDEIAARLARLEQKLDRLLAAVRSGVQGDPELCEHWAVMNSEGLELRLELSAAGGLSVGQLVHLKWILPHLPDRLFQCLARVVADESLGEGWRKVHMRFELADDLARDEIARAAFLAQRLGRRSRK